MSSSQRMQVERRPTASPTTFHAIVTKARNHTPFLATCAGNDRMIVLNDKGDCPSAGGRRCRHSGHTSPPTVHLPLLEAEVGSCLSNHQHLPICKYLEGMFQ